MMTGDILSLFLSAMRQAGIEPDCTVVADGRLHRFREWLDKPGKKSGWYVLFGDFPPAGAFGCWKRGISERWSGAGHNMSQLPKRIALIEIALAEEHQKGRLLASDMWRQAQPANGRHQYLKTKQVGAHDIRYLRGALLVPVMDVSGQLHGLQCIYHDGRKRFILATNKRGHFFMLGSTNGDVICIAEGYATAATVHQVTGHAVAVAFDTGNLLPVAVNLRAAFPQHRLVICADNDWRVEGNPGLSKARVAANEIGGMLICPRFSDPYSRGSDFNDLSLEEGHDAVLSLFYEKGAKKYV